MKKLLVSTVIGVLILGGVQTIPVNAAINYEAKASRPATIYRNCPDKYCSTKGAIAPFDDDCGLGYKCRTCGYWIRG